MCTLTLIVCVVARNRKRIVSGGYLPVKKGVVPKNSGQFVHNLVLFKLFIPNFLPFPIWQNIFTLPTKKGAMFEKGEDAFKDLANEEKSRAYTTQIRRWNHKLQEVLYL